MPDQNEPNASHGVQFASKLTLGSMALKSSALVDCTTSPWSAHVGPARAALVTRPMTDVVRPERRPGVVDVEPTAEVADVRRPQAARIRAERARHPRRNGAEDVAGVHPRQDVRGRPDVERPSRRKEVVLVAVPNHRRVVDADVEVRRRGRGRAPAERVSARAGFRHARRVGSRVGWRRAIAGVGRAPAGVSGVRERRVRPIQRASVTWRG